MDKLNFLKENAPCYLYDWKQIVDRCSELSSALPQVQFIYSIKANPFEPVVKLIADQGFGADAASANEVLLAEKIGIPSELIYYSAPGKTDHDLEKVMQKCTIIADSLSELDRLEQLCAKKDMALQVGLRINPLFSIDSSSTPTPNRFGIDEEQLLTADLHYDHLKITGIHVHLRSQILNPEVLRRYYVNCYSLAERLNDLPCVHISFINFGSGIGTVYDKKTQDPLPLERIGEILQELSDRNAQGLQAKLILESGRFLVCNAGTYVTRIIDRKVSHGKTFLIVQNGMNGYLRPAIAELLRKTLGTFPETGQEPFYSSPSQCSFEILGREGSEERVDIVGNLCATLDILAKDIVLPHAEIGDLLEITNAGSYGYSLTPLLFSGHEPPKQFLWEE